MLLRSSACTLADRACAWFSLPLLWGMALSVVLYVIYAKVMVARLTCEMEEDCVHSSSIFFLSLCCSWNSFLILCTSETSLLSC